MRRNVWLLALSLLWTKFLFSTTTSESKENAILVDFTSDLNVDNQIDQRRIILVTKEILSNASQILSRVINLPFQSVTFLVPNSWDIGDELGECFNSIRDAALHEKSSNANITIVSSGAFKVPISTQYQGCGQQGRRVTIPLVFLSENESSVERGKRFAKEWIKYRYGVFDENGFPDDPMFPEYYKITGDETIMITDCANKLVNYTYRTDGRQRECGLLVNSTTGLPVSNSNCRVKILPELNTEIRSSFLDGNINKLANVNEICSDHHYLHNKQSPNKQNLFCSGKSISEVIKQHRDFNKEGSLFADKSFDLKFNIVKEQNFRIAITLEDTSRLRTHEHLIKNAISSFAYSSPNGSQYTIIKFTEVLNIFPFTFVGSKVQLPLLHFREDVEQSKLAIGDAMEAATKVLMSSEELQAGTLVVITSSSPPNFVPPVLEKLRHLCLLVISVDENTANEWVHWFRDCNFSRTCKKVVDIAKNDFSSIRNTISAMNSIIDGEMENTHFVVKAASLTSKTSLSFIIGENVEYFDITITNEEKIRVDQNDFKLIQDNNITEVNLSEALFSYEVDFAIFRIKNNKTSEWKLELKIPNVELLVQVITRQINQCISPSPKVKIWLESENYHNDNYQAPVILYAELLSGSYPILHGKVVAFITLPDGNEISYIELYDDGIGDPDITKDDGIYSRYFTSFSTKGEYKVTIYADDNNGLAVTGYESSIDFCCGSSIRYSNTVSTEMFNVTAETSFEVTKEKPENGYTPSRIRDLRVWLTENPLTYTFLWRASGNERDSGTANYYELKLFETEEDAYNFSNEIFNKNASGAKSLDRFMQYEVDILKELFNQVNNSRVYYFALCAKNDKGLSSKVSNVVTVFISDRWPINEITVVPGTSPPVLLSDVEKIAIAVGSVVIVMVLICVGFVLFFYCNKDKKKPKKKDEENQQNPSISDKQNSSDSETNAKVNEWMTTSDSISPVSSVPAKVLLYHHEQVKDAKAKNKEPPLFNLNKLNSFKSESNAENNNARKETNDSDSQDSTYDNIDKSFEGENQPVENENSQQTSQSVYAKPYKKKQTKV